MSQEPSDPDLGLLSQHPVSYYFGQRLCAFLAWMCRPEYEGLSNIPESGPVILASNHRSHVDPPVIAALTRRPMCFVAKAELHRVPVLRTIIRHLNAMSVRRGRPDLAALKLLTKVLKAGHPVTIFPEGTRSMDGNLQQPEPGIGMLALRTQAPIVPLGIDGAERVMSRKAPIPLPRKYRVRAGEPITFPELYAKGRYTREDYDLVARTVMERIGELIGRPFVWQPLHEGEPGASEVIGEKCGAMQDV